MNENSFNPQQAEAFGQKMAEVLNHAGLALMISIGHRTGLFDVLAQLPAARSAEIAEAAKLNERYVREWLGAMTTGGIVRYHVESKTYQLPAEHAASLTRASSPNNLAVGAQFIAVLGAVEDNVVAAFRHGQGVPYSAYPRFHEVMAEESAQTVVAGFMEHILPLVPGLAAKLEHGIDVLDVGCGSGQAMIALAQRFPHSRFTGYDLSEEAVGVATAHAGRLRLDNVRFEIEDVARLGEVGVYDLVTAFDAIHDQAQPDAVLRNIARALRAGGTFLMQDISGSGHVHQDVGHPLGTLLYTISCMHCMSVSLAMGGPGLGAMWGKEKALSMLADAGFRNVRVETLAHDVMNFWYVAS